MFHPKRKSFFLMMAFALLTMVLALVSSCSDKTAEPKPEADQSSLTGSGNINPVETASFCLGWVSDSTVAPGRIEVWASNVAFDSANGFVTFDVQLVNRCRRNIVPPIHFVITKIVPDDIALVGFDGTTQDALPFFDFSTKLGADNVLEPGESSEAVMLTFHTVTARSFAVGFRIDLGGPSGPALISGVVFRDNDQNGMRDTCATCEPGIEGMTVALVKSLANGEQVTVLAKTDSFGAYAFGGLKEGVYKVSVVAPLERWKVTTTNPLLITLVKNSNGEILNFEDADFGLYSLLPPVPPPAELLFGPVKIGPGEPYGTLLDSTFVNPPSLLTVVYHYYILATPPLSTWHKRGAVDSASAWINDVLVFTYRRPESPDTTSMSCPPDSTDWWFGDKNKFMLPDSLVKFGENTIRLYTDGDEHAALMWRVFRKP